MLAKNTRTGMSHRRSIYALELTPTALANELLTLNGVTGGDITSEVVALDGLIVTDEIQKTLGVLSWVKAHKELLTDDSFQFVCCRSYPLRDDEVCDVLNAIKASNSRVKTLGFVGEKKLMHLSSAVLSKIPATNPHVRVLWLRGISLAGDIGASLFSAVAKQPWAEIVELDLSCNKLAFSGMEYLAASFMSLKTLRTLSIRRNAIAGNGTNVIAFRLRHLTQLTTLDLTGNDIGDEGCTSLSRNLRSNTAIQTLILAENDIGDEGARELGTLLAFLSNLVNLNLKDNRIGDVGARTLAFAIGNSQLSLCLNLQWNRVGNSGAAALGNLAAANSTLHELHLDGNAISEQGGALLARSLQKSATLTEMSIGQNPISAVMKKRVEHAVKANAILLNMGFHHWDEIQAYPPDEVLMKDSYAIEQHISKVGAVVLPALVGMKRGTTMNNLLSTGDADLSKATKSALFFREAPHHEPFGEAMRSESKKERKKREKNEKEMTKLIKKASQKKPEEKIRELEQQVAALMKENEGLKQSNEDASTINEELSEIAMEYQDDRDALMQQLLSLQNPAP